MWLDSSPLGAGSSNLPRYSLGYSALWGLTQVVVAGGGVVLGGEISGSDEESNEDHSS